MTNTNINIIMKSKIKQKSKKYLSNDICALNEETIQALQEIEKLKNENIKKTYSNFSDLLKEII